MTLQRLKDFAKQKMTEFPQYAVEIQGFVQLAIDEIEEGGSESHECELAYSDIQNLINEEE
jgi:hypothetical protein